MIKRSIKNNIIFVNIYACSIRTLRYIKQILTDSKREIYSYGTMVGNLNLSLTSTDRLSVQKINKETLALKTWHNRWLTDEQRIFHSKATEYILY